MQSVADKFLDALLGVTDQFREQYSLTYLEAIAAIEIYKFTLHAENQLGPAEEGE